MLDLPDIGSRIPADSRSFKAHDALFDHMAQHLDSAPPPCDPPKEILARLDPLKHNRLWGLRHGDWHARNVIAETADGAIGGMRTFDLSPAFLYVAPVGVCVSSSEAWIS